jgi:hypothetical protein
MTPVQSLRRTHIHLSEEEAEQLRNPITEDYTVEVQPPRHRDPSATLPEFIRGITEFQTRVLQLLSTRSGGNPVEISNCCTLSPRNA